MSYVPVTVYRGHIIERMDANRYRLYLERGTTRSSYMTFEYIADAMREVDELFGVYWPSEGEWEEC